MGDEVRIVALGNSGGGGGGGSGNASREIQLDDKLV